MGAQENKAVVQRYFDAVNAGDMVTIEDLLAPEAAFWVPPSLPDGDTYEGKEAVLRLFVESVKLYSADEGLRVELGEMTAEDDRVSAPLTIASKSALGDPYHNHYHFLFRVRDGKVVEIREHMDSLYAFRTLFVPQKMTTRESIPWLPE